MTKRSDVLASSARLGPNHEERSFEAELLCLQVHCHFQG